MKNPDNECPRIGTKMKILVSIDIINKTIRIYLLLNSITVFLCLLY